MPAGCCRSAQAATGSCELAGGERRAAVSAGICWQAPPLQSGRARAAQRCRACWQALARGSRGTSARATSSHRLCRPAAAAARRQAATAGAAALMRGACGLSLARWPTARRPRRDMPRRSKWAKSQAQCAEASSAHLGRPTRSGQGAEEAGRQRRALEPTHRPATAHAACMAASMLSHQLCSTHNAHAEPRGSRGALPYSKPSLRRRPPLRHPLQADGGRPSGCPCGLCSMHGLISSAIRQHSCTQWHESARSSRSLHLAATAAAAAAGRRRQRSPLVHQRAC